MTKPQLTVWKSRALSALDAGEEEIFELIGGGTSLITIAEKYGVSRNSVSNWIQAGGQERQERYEAARRAAADWHVHQSGAVLDGARHDRDLTPAQATIVRDQSKRHLWLAEKLDRQLYGEQPMQVNVGVSLGSLHLDALRQAGRKESGPILDAEIEP